MHSTQCCVAGIVTTEKPVRQMSRRIAQDRMFQDASHCREGNVYISLSEYTLPMMRRILIFPVFSNRQEGTQPA